MFDIKHIKKLFLTMVIVGIIAICISLFLKEYKSIIIGGLFTIIGAPIYLIALFVDRSYK